MKVFSVQVFAYEEDNNLPIHSHKYDEVESENGSQAVEDAVEFFKKSFPGYSHYSGVATEVGNE